MDSDRRNQPSQIYLNLSRQLHPLVTEYSIGNVPLSKVSIMRDLGVIVDSKLRFDEHIESASQTTA